ncbi:MAG: arylamine N-acetyltransferase [Sorangiineae bacterium]|nr:arylamine N-acetyltransferase [Polyangiaceae bacterium]MEB2324099.1 arylamine N-acetyltransferase [Sorangiineae bacterium]
MTLVADSALLRAYSQRIGLSLPARADREALDALILAHVRAIPFENLDILLGRPIRLDLDSIANKLVAGRRGGYCFENNALLAAVLRALGYRVRTLGARVHASSGELRARTHMVLEVELTEGPRLVDAGFGGRGPTAALRLAAGDEQPQDLDTYRLIAAEDDTLTLQVLGEGRFTDLYTFGRERYLPIDYELANYWTSTHPSSKFVRELIAVRATREGRFILHDEELLFRSAQGAVERRRVGSGEDRLAALSEHFGLTFPSGTEFHLGR